MGKYNTEQIEKYLKQLKLDALAKEWGKIPFINKEQYITDLLELELNEREAARISRAVKSAGFDVVKTVEDFIWNDGISIPKEL